MLVDHPIWDKCFFFPFSAWTEQRTERPREGEISSFICQCQLLHPLTHVTGINFSSLPRNKINQTSFPLAQNSNLYSRIKEVSRDLDRERERIGCDLDTLVFFFHFLVLYSFGYLQFRSTETSIDVGSTFLTKNSIDRRRKRLTRQDTILIEGLVLVCVNITSS